MKKYLAVLMMVLSFNVMGDGYGVMYGTNQILNNEFKSFKVALKRTGDLNDIKHKLDEDTLLFEREMGHLLDLTSDSALLKEVRESFTSFEVDEDPNRRDRIYANREVVKNATLKDVMISKASIAESIQELSDPRLTDMIEPFRKIWDEAIDKECIGGGNRFKDEAACKVLEKKVSNLVTIVDGEEVYPFEVTRRIGTILDNINSYNEVELRINTVYLLESLRRTGAPGSIKFDTNFETFTQAIPEVKLIAAWDPLVAESLYQTLKYFLENDKSYF